MRRDKNDAFRLREAGNSYKQIRDKLRIPLGTLSEWFSGEKWSQDIRAKLTEAAGIESSIRIRELDRVRGEDLARVYVEAREEARYELETYKYNPLFIAGMMLYLGEGDKATKNIVRLTNSDPKLIRLFSMFLRQACRVPDAKIKAQLLLYPGLDSESNIRFWSFATDIPIGQFTKSVYIEGRHKSRRLPNGVCTILVSSSYFKVKMLEWLKLMPEELMNRAYYERI